MSTSAHTTALEALIHILQEVRHKAHQAQETFTWSGAQYDDLQRLAQFASSWMEELKHWQTPPQSAYILQTQALLLDEVLRKLHAAHGRIEDSERFQETERDWRYALELCESLLPPQERKE